jgi:hypothetical protein
MAVGNLLAIHRIKENSEGNCDFAGPVTKNMRSRIRLPERTNAARR